jgi:hypothetical protein
MVTRDGLTVASDPHERVTTSNQIRAVVVIESTIIPSMLLALPREHRDPNRSVAGGERGRSRRIVGEATPICKIIIPDTARVVEPYFSPTSPPGEEREDHRVVTPRIGVLTASDHRAIVMLTAPWPSSSAAQEQWRAGCAGSDRTPATRPNWRARAPAHRPLPAPVRRRSRDARRPARVRYRSRRSSGSARLPSPSGTPRCSLHLGLRVGGYWRPRSGCDWDRPSARITRSACRYRRSSRTSPHRSACRRPARRRRRSRPCPRQPGS